MMVSSIQILSHRFPDSHFIVLSDESNRSILTRFGINNFTFRKCNHRFLFSRPGLILPRLSRPNWVHRIHNSLIDRFPSIFVKICLFYERLRNPPENCFHAVLSRLVSECDLIVFSGGGYICDPFPEKVENAYALAVLARAHKKPIFLTGHGITPCDAKLTKIRLNFILNTAKAIALRHPINDRCKFSKNIHDRIAIVGDDAFHATANKQRSERKGIGVNLRIAPYSTDQSNMIGKVAKIIERLAENDDVPIKPVPIALYPSNENDYFAIQRFFSCDTKGSIDQFLTEERIDFRIIREVIASTEIVFSMSYHACIFSLASLTPCIGLSASDYYDEKFNGIAHFFPNGFSFLRLDDPLIEANIQNTYRRIQKDREAQQKAISNSISQIDSRSKKFFNAIVDFTQT